MTAKTGKDWRVSSQEPTDKDFRTNKYLHEAVKQIREAHGKPKKGGKATYVPFAPEAELGPPLRCIINVAEYVAKHPGCTAVRCFKLFTETTANKQDHHGAKGVMHYVVRQANGELLDVTCEPGDRFSFCVPANWYPEVTDDDLLTSEVHMGAFILGTEERVALVLKHEGHDDEFGVATVTNAAAVRLMVNEERPPLPWNGIVAREDPKKRAQFADQCRVRPETIARWIAEAEQHCAAIGMALKIAEEESLPNMAEVGDALEETIAEVDGREACNGMAVAARDALASEGIADAGGILDKIVAF